MRKNCLTHPGSWFWIDPSMTDLITLMQWFGSSTTLSMNTIEALWMRDYFVKRFYHGSLLCTVKPDSLADEAEGCHYRRSKQHRSPQHTATLADIYTSITIGISILYRCKSTDCVLDRTLTRTREKCTTPTLTLATRYRIYKLAMRTEMRLSRAQGNID